MSSRGSSPFEEYPRSSNNQLARINTNSNEIRLENSQTITNLQFQISSLVTEKKLVQQEQAIEVNRYEDIIIKKNERFNKLKTNFDYLYEEKKQLESKIENQNQIHKAEVNRLNQKINELIEQSNENLKKFNELEASDGRLKRKYEQVSSNLNYQLNSNDYLNKEIAQLKNVTNELQRANDELVQELDNHSQRLNDSNSLNTLVENLQDKNISLQNINNKLQTRIDELLQHKTSTEVLKQKNISLNNKVSLLEGIEAKYCQLEIEKLELQSKFDDFFKAINESIVEDSTNESTNETKVRQFINLFKETKFSNLVLKNKYDELRSEKDQIQAQYEQLYSTNEENQLINSELQSELKVRNDVISKLERERLLNVKEIEFLRNSLKKMDAINNRKPVNDQQDTSVKATDEYLTKLEVLVDEYKTELETLRKKGQDSPSIGHKRIKIDQDTTTDLSQFKLSNYQNQIGKLEKENFDLSTKIKELESDVESLNNHIKNLETNKEKRNQLHILQLKSNLIAQDQVIKQQTLDLLRKENSDLIDKFINHLTPSEQIPKSIFERQENDKTILETNINQLNRRNSRLKDVYAKKSKDILAIISKYFGYNIEFLPNPINPNDLCSRIKLISKNNLNNVGNYIIIDIESKSLKAYGDYDFKTLCEDLSLSWVHDKNHIPCFLSALNLKLYESAKNS
ncbi:spindle assembly checkpoint component MAD1 [Scheffersomyces amazonensis]|uniref:spindle assembly checkpoint component MAD1 n=1 Tax=Scheffersomyces amazonensis TaxID=1078765 RepID=UPI00315DB9DB